MVKMVKPDCIVGSSQHKKFPEILIIIGNNIRTVGRDASSRRFAGY
ncbi:MAG: hypothetical protein PHX02_03505 [Oscillospiraceae bacterium]|nr:hypothetical protein [Oscillospiraceae bacterium]